jgi:MATE family multidrug resistance protein
MVTLHQSAHCAFLLTFLAPQVPVAILLGFYFKLGVAGLYSGMVLGPAIQTACYLALIWKLSWSHEAHMARQRAVAAAAPL